MTSNKFTAEINALEKAGGTTPQILIILIKEVIALRAKLESTTNNVSKAKSRLDNIEVTTVEKMIKETQEHVSNLQDVASIAITKTTVSTELNFYLKNKERLLNVMIGVNKAMDFGDNFWRGKSNVTLGELADLFDDIGQGKIAQSDINRLTT